MLPSIYLKAFVPICGAQELKMKASSAAMNKSSSGKKCDSHKLAKSAATAEDEPGSTAGDADEVGKRMAEEEQIRRQEAERYGIHTFTVFWCMYAAQPAADALSAQFASTLTKAVDSNASAYPCPAVPMCIRACPGVVHTGTEGRWKKNMKGH